MPLILGTTVLLCAFVLSLLATAVAIRLGRRWGAVDGLGERKIHRSPVPFLGGPALFAAFVLVIGSGLAGAALLEAAGLGASWLPPQVRAIARSPGGAGLRLLGILIGAGSVLALGLVDDVRGLRVGTRFLVQFAAAGAVVAAGVRPDFLGLPTVIAVPVAVLWIVGMTNAFNFIDGMDGLCAGVAAIASGILAYHLSAHDQPMVALLLLALLGAILGFLRWNFVPARIFLGNAGAMCLGFLLGSITLEGAFLTAEHNSVLPAVLPVLVLGVPLYDAASVVAIRLANGRSPFRGDQNHLHHRLRRTGMSVRQTVLFIYLLAFSVGINATLLPDVDPFGGLVILVQVSAAMGLLVVLERVIRRSDHGGDTLAAVPADYEVVDPEGRPVDSLAGTARVRRLEREGCVLEPAKPITGRLSDFFEARWLVRVRIAPDGAAPITTLGAVRGVEQDRDGAQTWKLEFRDLSRAERGRLDEWVEARGPGRESRVASLESERPAA
ncbi:MAG: undecaprenyl/decaprenyl-phosphate alpha-N-acetylglucosaminyl 1-phosphate transferase [Planctomycetales bacterium]|nr:undecaprenyl/decaprenyl-phosphate alpha-N-acetylglucosaminyl 1-phosphate transferase [Planctomycetales bacterium]